MKDYKNTFVSVSLEENGSTLIRRGNYVSAIVKVKNAFETDKSGKSLEEIDYVKRMETVSEPIVKKSTKTLTLGYSFIEGALNINKQGKSERPRKPHQKASKKEWDLWKNWNKTSDSEKIKVSLISLAHDCNCVLISFEILE